MRDVFWFYAAWGFFPRRHFPAAWWRRVTRSPVRWLNENVSDFIKKLCLFLTAYAQYGRTRLS